MKNCRIEKIFEVAGSGELKGREMIGGLYPGVVVDDEFFLMLGAAESAPELEGLQPEGFVPGSKFSLENFDLDKLKEIRETALEYFCVIDGYDCEADLDNMLALVRELHSAPESITKGELQAGELILAMWMAGVPFRKFKYQDLPETVVFGVDWDEVSDPAIYIDNDHGFENLLRPSAAWMRNEHLDKWGSDMEFISMYPRVEEACHGSV